MNKNNDLEGLSNRDLVVAVLREVAIDRAAPAQSRQAAARSLGEIEAMLGKNSDGAFEPGAKSLTELSVAEIDAELRRLKKA